MKLKKLGSDKVVNVNLGQYRVKWDRKVSEPQFRVKTFLRGFWERDAVYEEVRIPGSLFRLDLLNLDRNLVVEVSPNSVHSKYNPFIHKNRYEFLKKVKADEAKRQWVEHHGWKLVELDSQDIKNLSKELLETKFSVNL